MLTITMRNPAHTPARILFSPAVCEHLLNQGTELEFDWTRGEALPIYLAKKTVHLVTTVEADGVEKCLIESICKNLPTAPQTVIWRGEMAQFVVDNYVWWQQDP